MLLVTMNGLRCSQRSPVQPLVQVQVLGCVQVPPFIHDGSQIAMQKEQ